MSYPFPAALWVLEVPEATPSLNAWAHKHDVHLYPRIRAHWKQQLVSAWYAARASSPQLAGFVPPRRGRLIVERRGPRLLDPDNLVGGLKPVIDALRRLQLIVDDAPAALTLDVRQQRAPTGSTLLVLDVWPTDIDRPEVGSCG